MARKLQEEEAKQLKNQVMGVLALNELLDGSEKEAAAYGDAHKFLTAHFDTSLGITEAREARDQAEAALRKQLGKADGGKLISNLRKQADEHIGPALGIRI